MKQIHFMSNTLFGAAGAMVAMAITSVATATEPCGDLGECKALIEINATDGDIGFHFLMDGDDLIKSEVRNPDGQKIFEAIAKKEEREQFMTETFVESAEPLCWDTGDPDDDVEDIVTLEEFLELWSDGTYEFIGKGEEGEMVSGETELLHYIPAAPENVLFNSGTRLISWTAGFSLGECATEEELDALIIGPDPVLPAHPKDVMVVAWEVVFEPDVEVEDDAPLSELEAADALSKLKFTVRVPLSQTSVKVPEEYILSLPEDTPAKIEVGAFGVKDNATFTEISDICAHENAGC